MLKHVVIYPHIPCSYDRRPLSLKASAYASPVTRTFTIENSGDIASAEQAKELTGLCHAGKLYEVEKWIAAGKSLDISAGTKRGRQAALLQIAVETGFHSLVAVCVAQNWRAWRWTRSNRGSSAG